MTVTVNSSAGGQGIGRYIAVGGGVSTPSAPYVLINDRFVSTLNYATEWALKGDTFFEELKEKINDYSLPPGFGEDIGDVIIEDVPPVNWQDRPLPIGPQLNNNWPTEFPFAPVLAPVPNVDPTIKQAEKPADVNPTISHQDQGYDASMALRVYQTIYNDIENGGTGLSQDVIDAITDNYTIQNNRIETQEYDKLIRAAGATGFRFASGVVAGILLQNAEKRILRNREANNALLIQNFEFAQKNKFFAIEKGIDYDKVTREFFNNRENRTLQAEIAAAQLVLQVYAEKMRGFLAEVEANVKEGELKLNMVRVVAEQNRVLLEKYLGELEGVKRKTEIIASENDAKVKGYLGEVEGYKAENEALETYYNAIAKNYESKMRKAELELQRAVEELRAILQGKISYDTLTSDLAKFASQLAQQAVASAFNAVNASASMGYSGSESIAENYGFSAHLSETHNTQHDTNEPGGPTEQAE